MSFHPTPTTRNATDCTETLAGQHQLSAYTPSGERQKAIALAKPYLKKDETMAAYCLFCVTQKCQDLAPVIACQTGLTVLYPQQVQHTWEKGKMVDRRSALLPGYLFVYAPEPLEIPQLTFKRYSGVLRILGKKEENYILRGDDERFAQSLLAMGGEIGRTKVFQEGQMIHLTDQAFGGVNARILKVNRRNGRMQVEIPFAENLIKTWVEYEMVEEIHP